MFLPMGRLLLAAYLALGLVDAWKAESTAIATVTPCPSPSQWRSPSPITVTSQYQPVSTCTAGSEVCVKNKCWIQYSYSTYDFISTVIPCPLASPLAISTITTTDQKVLVSRSSDTITNTYPTTIVTRKWRRPITITTTASSYTTIIKEWSAPYKNLGPYAIPGYQGSGICHQCKGPKGQKLQLLDVIECHQTGKATVCREYPEAWVFDSKPSLSRTASAVCSTKTSVSTPGIYVFKFPQRAPPATIPVPAQTVTYTAIGGQVLTSTNPATTTVFPGRDWTATVTRTCTRPTTITFEVIVTRVIVYIIPPFVFPNGP